MIEGMGMFEIGLLLSVGWYLKYAIDEAFAPAIDHYFCKPASECSQTYRCPKCGEEAR